MRPRQSLERARVQQGQVAWTALADTYSAAVLMPQEPAGDAVIARRLGRDTLELVCARH